MNKDTLTHPKLTIEGSDAFLKSIGVKLSESKDGYHVSNVRVSNGTTFYGFKHIEDYRTMVAYLIENQIPFEVCPISTGARYEHHLAIKQ